MGAFCSTNQAGSNQTACVLTTWPQGTGEAIRGLKAGLIYTGVWCNIPARPKASGLEWVMLVVQYTVLLNYSSKAKKMHCNLLMRE